MPKIITSAKLFSIEDKRGIEILENFSLKDIQNKPEDMFRKYFLGSDEEYERFLVNNGLKIDYEKFTRDDLIFKFTPYLERFCSRADNSNFDSILQSIHKTKQVNSKMLMQEMVYDFSDFSKEDFNKFIKEYEYKSSSLLSFMTIDEVSQKIKTYAINKNLVELKEIKEDIDSRDNYLKISVDIAKSVPKLEPRLDLKGVKANTMSGIKQNTITLTELQGIYRTLAKVGIYDIVLYNRNFHDGEIGNAVYFPSNFLHASELDEKHLKIEEEFETLKENSIIEKKPTTIKNIDKVIKVQGGSLNKGEGLKKVIEEEATKVKVKDKVTIEDVEDDINYSEFVERLKKIEDKNSVLLSEHIDAEIETLKQTKNLIPEATEYTLQAIKKGSTITKSLQSLNQTYRKYPQLPMLVEENLRIKFLSIKAKDTLIENMQKEINSNVHTIEKIIKEIEDKNQKISTLKTENSVLNEKYIKDIDELSTSIEKLSTSIENLQKDNDLQKELLDEQEDLLKNKDLSIEELEKNTNNLSSIIDTLESTKSELENQLKASKNSLIDLEKQLVSKNELLKSTEKQLKSKDEIIKSKDELIKSIEKQLKSIEKQLVSKNELLQSIEEQLTLKNKEVEKQFTKIDTLESTKSELENQLQSKEKSILLLEKELKSKDEIISKNKKNSANDKVQIDILMQKIETLEKKKKS